MKELYEPEEFDEDELVKYLPSSLVGVCHTEGISGNVTARWDVKNLIIPYKTKAFIKKNYSLWYDNVANSIDPESEFEDVDDFDERVFYKIANKINNNINRYLQRNFPKGYEGDLELTSEIIWVIA